MADKYRVRITCSDGTVDNNQTTNSLVEAKDWWKDLHADVNDPESIVTEVSLWLITETRIPLALYPSKRKRKQRRPRHKRELPPGGIAGW